MAIPLDPNRCEAMVMERLPEWVAEAQAMFNEHYEGRYATLNPPEVYIAGGRKYIKIAKRGGGSNSVWCFVRAEDGAILKAASWKAPALNFARGSIFDKHVPNCVYGF